MVLWAVAMAVILFFFRATAKTSGDALLAGIVVTFVFGAYLGWRRRVAAVFVAPLISWMFAWIPLIVASMIRDGIVGGFFVGIFWASVGWLFIAFLEFLGLFVSAMAIRALRPSGGPSGPDVTLFGPGGNPP